MEKRDKEAAIKLLRNATSKVHNSHSFGSMNWPGLRILENAREYLLTGTIKNERRSHLIESRG